MKNKSAGMRAFAGTTVILSVLLSMMACSRALAGDKIQPNSDAAAAAADASASPTADSTPAAMTSTGSATASTQESTAAASRPETILIDTSSSKSRPISSSLPTHLRALAKSSNDSNEAKYKPGIPCVPLMLVDDPSTLIVCDRESVMKAENRCITLSQGKGIYMVGKHPMVVETPLGSVNLPGNSAAIIEQNENGLLRVDHLTGAPSTVTVKRWKGTKAFSASSGEEICLAPREVPLADLVAGDGVTREEISTEVGDGGIQFTENKFTPKTLLDKECLLQCDSNSFFQVRRKVYQLRKMIDDQETASAVTERRTYDAQESMPLLILGSELGEVAQQVVPVTFSEPATVQLPLRSSRSGTALFKFNSKSDIGFDHPSVSELKGGEVLVSADKTTFVKTPHSMVRIEGGTLALVSVTDDVTKVRNLWENHRNGVAQLVDNTPFQIVAGDESLASKDLRSIYLAASKDMIGRRMTHYTELPGGNVVHFAEVSLISLAQSDDLLLQLMNSSDPIDKSLNRKLNKMAAILVQISASHGLYELMQPPQWKRDSKSSFLGPVLY